MSASTPIRPHDTFIHRHPVASYFVLTYAVSWTGAFLVAAPKILRGQPISKIDGLLMFPAMLLGPSLIGFWMTRTMNGNSGLRDLFARMSRIHFPLPWLATLLIPPALIFIVLNGLRMFVSPVFAPSHYWIGASFGIAAGFLEEIGWTGFAFPTMSSHRNALTASILLGLLWGIWHIPVIDYLGTATPHGAYWLRYFLAFTAAMTAVRILIGWIYRNTKSVLLAQLTHISSTGSLVVFSPTRVTAGQEAIWYVVYAAALWIVVLIVIAIYGTDLGQVKSN